MPPRTSPRGDPAPAPAGLRLEGSAALRHRGKRGQPAPEPGCCGDVPAVRAPSPSAPLATGAAAVRRPPPRAAHHPADPLHPDPRRRELHIGSGSCTSAPGDAHRLRELHIGPGAAHRPGELHIGSGSRTSAPGAAHRLGALPPRLAGHQLAVRASRRGGGRGGPQAGVVGRPFRSRTAGGAAPEPSRPGRCIPAGSATAPTAPRGAGAPRAPPALTDGGTAAAGGALPQLPQPLRPGSALLARQPRQGSGGRPGGSRPPWGLTAETRLLLRDRPGGAFPVRRRYRQSWVLVGILGGDQLSRAGDKQEYNEKGTTGLAIAQRDFLTYDGTCFTVTAFNGWIKGMPHSGFKVEVSRGIILHLVDEVMSWLPGDLVSSLPVQIILCIGLKSLISFLVQGKTVK
ncbi:uncharacterized protein [Taeniopygia guttata]|uniref:uncharacterized protein isoform X1 n=1 Tax=Taeniopygia guttata TaxID=59729 RepID=UPI0011AED1C1|nr:translation initiation factor IF-2-like [Taeniopygia guttata]